jgi:hypothetical protein
MEPTLGKAEPVTFNESNNEEVSVIKSSHLYFF